MAEIVCVAPDNAFVMAEWGKAHGAEGKVRQPPCAGGGVMAEWGRAHGVSSDGCCAVEWFFCLRRHGFSQ